MLGAFLFLGIGGGPGISEYEYSDEILAGLFGGAFVVGVTLLMLLGLREAGSKTGVIGLKLFKWAGIAAVVGMFAACITFLFAILLYQSYKGMPLASFFGLWLGLASPVLALVVFVRYVDKLDEEDSSSRLYMRRWLSGCLLCFLCAATLFVYGYIF